MTPDFLAIGHVAKDLTPGGYTLGGAVTYSAIAAKRMGLNPAVVTSVGPDVDPRSAMPDIPVHIVPSRDTTTFVNTYHDGKRTQLIKGVGGPIMSSDIPAEWLDAPLVMLGSLAGELDDDLVHSFPKAIMIASVQGWLRRWDDEGHVNPGYWSGKDVLPFVDAAILSIDDVADIQIIDEWKDITPVLIVTKARDGAELHMNGEWHHIDAFPTTEVDPTGAGDVFAAAYLIRLSETSDPLESARFASCAASFCVEDEGVRGIPTRAQVEGRLAEYRP